MPLLGLTIDRLTLPFRAYISTCRLHKHRVAAVFHYNASYRYFADITLILRA